jgi:hypothetical protein
VDALSRSEVVAFLEKTHPESCIGYLEHLINDLNETGAEYHDKLVELYLEEARGQKEEEGDDRKAKLLSFLDGSTDYRAHRILGKLKGDGQSCLWSDFTMDYLLICRITRGKGHTPREDGQA